MTKMFDVFEEEITHVCEKEGLQIGRIDQRAIGFPYNVFFIYYNFLFLGKIKIHWEEYEFVCSVDITMESPYGKRNISHEFHLDDKYGWYVFMEDYRNMVQDMKEEGEREF